MIVTYVTICMIFIGLRFRIHKASAVTAKTDVSFVRIKKIKHFNIKIFRYRYRDLLSRHLIKHRRTV